MTARSNTLRIGDDFELDADYAAGAAFAVLAKRGAGKTYTGRVMVEEYLAAKVQVVVVDPTGSWWGLRSRADGEGDGVPLPIFGGRHGDAPLEPTAGPLIADLVVDDGLSMILDLKDFTTRQVRQFAAEFFDRLFRRNRHLVHLLIDEADVFAPQVPRKSRAGEVSAAELLETVENLVRRGRNHGIGVTLISQRSAVLNKSVLSQVDGLVALRTTAAQDRDAIRAWVHSQGDDDLWTKVAPSLPSLATGESWWWIPEKDVLRKVQIRAARTFDSSPNRRRDQSGREPKTFADVNLRTIRSRIAATIERAEENDPKVLQRRIANLEGELARRDRQLAEAHTATPVPPPPVEVLDPADVERLEVAIAGLGRPEKTVAEAGAALLEQLEQTIARLAAAAEEIASAADGVIGALRDRATPLSTPSVRPVSQPRPEWQPARPPRPVSSPQDAVSDLDPPIKPAQQRLLDALAALEAVGVAQVPKKQLALWTGTSPKSSGYSNNLGALRSGGLIDYPQPGAVALTSTGRALADTSMAATLTTTEALHSQVRTLLSPAQWRIIEVLIAAYPQPVPKNELATAIGVSPNSSGYSNNLGRLRSFGLIHYPQPRQVVAASILFLDR